MWEHKRQFRGYIKTEKINFFKRSLGDVSNLVQNSLIEDVIIVYMETELAIPGDMKFGRHWINIILKQSLMLRKFSLETLEQNPFF